MKKVSLLLVMMLSLITSNVFAQQSGDYFLGKWDMLLQGAPDGDMKLTMLFERNDGKLEATIQGLFGSSDAKITDIEEQENSIILYFSVSEYDVDLKIEKVDDDNVKGDIVGMVFLKGERIKSD